MNRLTDEQAHEFVKAFRDFAIEVSGDYPDKETAPCWELLWAVRCTIEGTDAALEGWARLARRMQEELGWSTQKMIEEHEKLTAKEKPCETT